MAWPPRPGELLPRAEEAFGVRHKLMTYSLVKNHHSGGAKAKGFERILGITSETVEHLESEILRGILVRPIALVRSSSPFGTQMLRPG